MKSLIKYLDEIDYHVEPNEAYESLSESYQSFVSEDYDRVSFTIERENATKIKIYNTSFDVNLLIHGQIEQDKHNDLHADIEGVEFLIFFENNLEERYIKDIKNKKLPISCSTLFDCYTDRFYYDVFNYKSQHILKN